MRRFVCGIALSALATTSLCAVPAAAQARQSPHAQTVSAEPADQTPHVLDGEVVAIAVVGGTVVLVVRTQARTRPPGARSSHGATSWRSAGRPERCSRTSRTAVDAEVRTLAVSPDGTSVYVGGKFNCIDGRVSSKLTRLEVATGAPVPGFEPGLVDAAVFDVELAGDRLIVAGYFTTLAARHEVASPSSTGERRGGSRARAGGQRTAWGGATAVTKLDVTPTGRAW